MTSVSLSGPSVQQSSIANIPTIRHVNRGLALSKAFGGGEELARKIVHALLGFDARLQLSYNRQERNFIISNCKSVSRVALQNLLDKPELSPWRPVVQELSDDAGTCIVTLSALEWINKRLLALYLEEVNNLTDPNLRQLREKITILTIEGFETGICHYILDGVTMLRQIPPELLQECRQAKSEPELQMAVKKVAQFHATFPFHTVLTFEGEVGVDILIKGWMTKNPYIRELASQYGVLQMLQDKDTKKFNVLVFPHDDTAQTRFMNMLEKFMSNLKPIQQIIAGTEHITVGNGQSYTLFKTPQYLLWHCARLIRENNLEFIGTLDAFAEYFGDLGKGVKQKLYEEAANYPYRFANNATPGIKG